MRCIYCDYSEEIAKDSGVSRWRRSMSWDVKEKGFVCHVCTGEVRDALSDFNEVEGPEFLALPFVDEDQGNSLSPG